MIDDDDDEDNGGFLQHNYGLTKEEKTDANTGRGGVRLCLKVIFGNVAKSPTMMSEVGGTNYWLRQQNSVRTN